jgi:hypothetical protein
MGRRRRRETTLPAPYLRRVWLDRLLVEDWEAYPFCLPIFRDEFDLSFDSAITIIVWRERLRQIDNPRRDRRALITG